MERRAVVGCEHQLWRTAAGAGDARQDRLLQNVAPAELIATSWTSAGNVRPGRTGGVSPIDIADRIEAFASSGCLGRGLGWDDLQELENSIGFGELRQCITAAGRRHIEIEFLNDWWINGPRRTASDLVRAGLVRAAEHLGARRIKVVGGDFGDTRDHTVLRTELRLLADQANDHGTRIVLEPGAGFALDLAGEAIPLRAHLTHLALGRMLEPWHLVRAGLPYEQVLSTLTHELFGAVELSDGAAVRQCTLFDDTFDRRLPPDQGDFGVLTFVTAVRRVGFNGPWGVEVMSERTRTRTPVEVLLECAAAARECL